MSLTKREIARDITYAHCAASRTGRAVIRLIENATGRVPLMRRAEGYLDEVAAGTDFWAVMVARYGLSLEVTGGALGNIPREGPAVVVANHPYGILDGLMMGHILAQTRGDFRILANSVFHKARDINRAILPISFDATKEAQRQNIETRRTALDYLGNGGCIGVFPGGTVSTGATPFARPMDPAWRGFTARMIAKSGATVVPLFFEGHTRRRFQIASHLSSLMRVALLISEFRARVDGPVRVVVGEPIPPDRLANFNADAKQMMDFLRKATYDLNPEGARSFELGYDFEK